MEEADISKYLKIIYDFQNSKSDKNLIVKTPLTQREVKVSSLLTEKYCYDIKGKVEKRFWAFRKKELPTGIKSIYFFVYGGETSRECVHISFNRSTFSEAIAEVLSEKSKNVEVEKTRKGRTLFKDNEKIITIAPQGRRVIVYPQGEKNQYILNKDAVKLIEVIKDLQEIDYDSNTSLSFSLSGRQIMLPLPTIYLKNQLIRKKCLESKILSANDHEIKNIVYHYRF